MIQNNWREIQRKQLTNILREQAHLYENKDHLINKISSLTPEQKEKVIAFFHKHPNYENKIDWNKKDLAFSDFERLLANEGRSQTQAEKKGLAGIKEGLDYIVVDDQSPKYIAYQPLTYLGSKTIASNLVPPAKENGAQWCTAYQKTTQYWDGYTERGIKFIYVCDLIKNTKYAIVLYPENLESKIECYTFGDRRTTIPEKYKYLCSKELKDYKPFDLQEDYIDTGYLIFNRQTHRYDCPNPEKINIKKLVKDGKFIIPLGVWKGDFDCACKQLTTLENVPKEVIGNFYCYGNRLTSLEGAPEKVQNEFHCYNNKLTTLKGSPKVIEGKFNCYVNKLTSLEGGPEVVYGAFDCNHNELTNLEGAPKEVHGYFACSKNKLISLEGIPERIDGGFDCNENKLTSLKGSPRKVNGSFSCSNNNLSTLEGAPEEVKGHFDCVNNQLTTLEGAPEYVGTSFNCSSNNLTTLEGSPEYIGSSFYCNNNQLRTLEGAPEKVNGDFFCYKNKLIDLKGAPKIIEGWFHCANNNIVNLEGAPEYVGSHLYCDSEIEKELRTLLHRS